MKAIRISDEAYNFLQKMALQEKRSLISTLDLFIQLFKEVENEDLEEGSLSSAASAKTQDKKQALAKIKKKGI